MELLRVGRFNLSRDTIKKHPALVRKAMGMCIIIRAEMMYAEDGVEYTALSPEFKEVPLGERVPFYRSVVSWGSMGPILRWEEFI